MTDKLATALKRHMESLTIAPFADGRFEVFVDDERVYSKLDTGSFPDQAELVARVAAMVSA